MGYHVKNIERGIYGEFSKIVEEFDELCDAHEQDAKILELVELSDLVGAIDGYVRARYGMKLMDVIKMTRMTQEAFEEGKR